MSRKSKGESIQIEDTAGEKLFKSYLDRFSIDYVRPPATSTSRTPDFILRSSMIDVAFENKDIEWTALDQELLQRAVDNGGAFAEAAEIPTGKVIQKLFKALEKLEAVPDGMPFIPVLFNSGSAVQYTNRCIMEQALFGPTCLSVLVGPDGPLSEYRHTPTEDMNKEDAGRKGFFGRSESRRVSAVGVVWEHKINSDRWADFLHQRICEIEPDVWGDFRRSAQLIIEHEEALRSEFESQFGSVHTITPRLDVYHNPFAEAPLPAEFFSFDDHCYQFWFDRKRNGFIFQE